MHRRRHEHAREGKLQQRVSEVQSNGIVSWKRPQIVRVLDDHLQRQDKLKQISTVVVYVQGCHSQLGDLIVVYIFQMD